MKLAIAVVAAVAVAAVFAYCFVALFAAEGPLPVDNDIMLAGAVRRPTNARGDLVPGLLPRGAYKAPWTPAMTPV